MLKTTEIVPDFDLYNSILNCEPENTLFFDIETTGLSPVHSMVFLIGTIHFDGDNWLLTQFLAQHDEDEILLLQSFFQLAGQFHTLIHFNGSSFDVPYLKERASHYIALNDSSVIIPDESYQIPELQFSGLYRSFCQMDSIDLYQYFRPLKKLLKLPRMNQQTLEQFLGWKRQDQLTGKHMVSLFKKYTASREKLISNLLFLHNHDDLIGMTQILKLASYQMLSNASINHVSAVLLSEQFLQITFELEQPLPQCLNLYHPPVFGSDVSVHSGFITDKPSADSENYIHLSITDCHGTISIPVFCGELKYFFPDYRNYYYLPSEDQAIHKSIGSFVDSAHRENARPATCYVKKTGRFLWQPEPVTEPAFRSCYNSKELYFECTEDLFQNAVLLMRYVQSVLRSFIPLQ